jgi:tRNA pseudouridine38-40 synthase
VTTKPSTTWRLLIAYRGTRFKGWQRGNGRTVQGTLEEAIGAAIGEAGQSDVRVDGAGRTDAGAHAEGQVASLVLSIPVDPARLLAAVNRALPGDVSVLSIEEAGDRFHARYRATAKTYRYRIVDGPVPNPFLTQLSWRQLQPLDIDAMRNAARLFLGKHDFSAFTQAKTTKSTERRVHSIGIERTVFAGGPVMEITVRGDGFLWKQVRAMVGALVAVGLGHAEAGQIDSLFASGDRALAPSTAPASGLTLVSVEYE